MCAVDTSPTVSERSERELFLFAKNIFISATFNSLTANKIPRPDECVHDENRRLTLIVFSASA